ncbi:glycosyltransferase [Terrisporobacter vanillatitrophus]|uniref:glycosyltransferase n=1 Tax=Terrisporobacter vanillatitrophus TaxID=3058402 RepID=UPI003366CC4B
MILSIAMIVKNEEKNLKRTLESLKNLTTRISSEIIIVDTGSDDNTVEIAKEYTDHVYFEKWNDDFANMRNKSISYCSGEWILILDADEELIKCDKLVEFLNCDKNTQFNTCKITLKNLISSNDFSKYIMANCVRIFKNKDDFRYEGCIHEQPMYSKPEYSESLAEFNHYGYIYEDKEFKRKKLMRNEKLLLKEYNKNKNNIYINYQLAKNYMCEKKYEIAITFLEDGLKLNEDSKNINRYIYLYEEICKAYYLAEEYSLCEEKCEDYIKIVDNNNIDIYYYLANSQKKNKKLEKSILSYKRYLNLVNDYKKSTQFKSVYSINSTGCDSMLCIEELMDVYYMLDQYEDIIKLYEEKIGDKNCSDEILYLVIKTLINLNKIYKITEYYIDNCKTDECRERFIIQIEKNLSNSEELNLELKEIYSELSKIEGNYGQLNKIRNGKILEVCEYIKILQCETEEFYGDIIHEILIKDILTVEKLNVIDISKLQLYIDYIVENKYDISEKLYGILESNSITFYIKNIKVYLCIAKSLLLKGQFELEYYKIIYLYYNVYQYNYIKCKYAKTLSDLEILENTADESERFLLEIKLLNNKNNENISNYIKIIKKIASKYSSYRNAIKAIKEEISEYIQQNKEVNNLKSEYKAKISQVIELNNIKVAQKMINEYKQIFSDDSDIMNMEAVIAIMLNDINEATKKIKYAYLKDSNNTDILFNMAYISELKGEINQAKDIYMFVISNFKGEIKQICEDRINNL